MNLKLICIYLAIKPNPVEILGFIKFFKKSPEFIRNNEPPLAKTCALKTEGNTGNGTFKLVPTP